MIKLVLATMNRGKIREMKTILEKYNVDILSSLDFPRLPPVEEDGSTFRENAVKKALSVYRHTGLSSLADDSGLDIDALDGRPGIRSSRFAGPDGDDEKNIGKVLTLMRDIPEQNRQARSVASWRLSTQSATSPQWREPVKAGFLLDPGARRVSGTIRYLLSPDTIKPSPSLGKK